MLASALLAGLYVRGGAAWPLGFVMLVPWLAALDAGRTLAARLACAYAMTLAYTAAAFAWFGVAIGRYAEIGEAAGLLLLLAAAPLLQPQWLAFVLVRHLAGRRCGRVLQAGAAACAWVGAEWLLPRLLGDTLGQGLHPSRWLRQAADLGGAAGLTLLLLLANEAFAAAWARRSQGWRAIAVPLVPAALLPLALAAYGVHALSALPAPSQAGPPLRVGLVQANIADYERRRREQGAEAVVREVLDTHFAMSYDAVERQQAQVVLWSETVYPTTFGQPKSEAGADFDREILATLGAAGVPFVFGTYDRDGAGEYNAAAFVAPERGLVGFYRKTRLFPLTEAVPAWLDGPLLRRWLPWAGSWRAGSGARVFPLRLGDGREIPVLPLICRDDVDAGLAIDGARLGARAIVTLSNDAWFADSPLGARLHLQAAAFRSIETRLPQWRVTTDGLSALIDATGTVLARAPSGTRTLVIGEAAVPEPPRTLMVAWGDWVGRAACGLLALMALVLGWPRGPCFAAAAAAEPTPVTAVVLPPLARLAAGLLRVLARASLLGLGAALLFGDELAARPLAQIRLFAGLVLAPEAAAWCLLRAFDAQLRIERGRLVLLRGTQRRELLLADIVALQPWRLSLPMPGLTLRLAGGAGRLALAVADPLALAASIACAQGAAPPIETSLAARLAQARAAIRPGTLDRPWAKFGLLPLALALPAFQLHQHIAYGGPFGEAQTFGLAAYGSTFLLWWAAWAIGIVLFAGVLRTAAELGALLVLLLRPPAAPAARQALERLRLAALYAGPPALLLLRLGA